jgi:hypothetical protein
VSLSTILDQGALVGALARREQLPCCTLVALVVLAIDGHPAASVASGALIASRVYPAGWWHRANLRTVAGDELELVLRSGEDAREWDPVQAAAEVFGGSVVFVELDDPRPSLGPGTYVVQQWSGSRGHTYLVSVDPDGMTTRRHSSTSKGYREETAWELPSGCRLGILQLP